MSKQQIGVVGMAVMAVIWHLTLRAAVILFQYSIVHVKKRMK